MFVHNNRLKIENLLACSKKCKFLSRIAFIILICIFCWFLLNLTPLKLINIDKKQSKCDEIFLNLYRFHSTVGSAYPKKNYSLYDLSLYKSFNDKRDDNAQIEHVWFVDFDYLDIKNVSNKEKSFFISNTKILDLIEFSKKLSFTTYVDHQLLNKMFGKYLSPNDLAEKNIALLGLYDKDYVPWIESFLHKTNKHARLTIIDYQDKVYENTNFKWVSLVNYLNDKYLSSIKTQSQYDEYDIVISHHLIDKVNL